MSSNTFVEVQNRQTKAKHWEQKSDEVVVFPGLVPPASSGVKPEPSRTTWMDLLPIPLSSLHKFLTGLDYAAQRFDRDDRTFATKHFLKKNGR